MEHQTQSWTPVAPRAFGWRRVLDAGLPLAKWSGREASQSAIPDPLKLHYTWSLWQIGVASEWHWLEECAATREAIVNARLRFSDVYLMKSIDPWVARQQRDAGPTRSRRNFDLHVQLDDPLVTWYRTMERLLPGAVILNLPDKGLASLSNLGDPATRSSIQIFNRMIGLLPNATSYSSKARPQALEA